MVLFSFFFFFFAFAFFVNCLCMCILSLFAMLAFDPCISLSFLLPLPVTGMSTPVIFTPGFCVLLQCPSIPLATFYVRCLSGQRHATWYYTL